MTKEGFMRLMNDKRKANKNNWIFVQEKVGNVLVVVKSYNTWIQYMYTNDGKKYSGPMDCKVSEFNSFLDEVLSNIKE